MSEVTPTPSGAGPIRGRGLAAETTAVLEAQVGPPQSGLDCFNSGSLARARGYVTQFQGNQMNCSSSWPCKFVQLEQALGSKCCTCTSLTLSFFLSRVDWRILLASSKGRLCGQTRRTPLAPARCAVTNVLSSRPTPQISFVSLASERAASDVASGATTTICMAVLLLRRVPRCRTDFSLKAAISRRAMPGPRGPRKGRACDE